MNKTDGFYALNKIGLVLALFLLAAVVSIFAVRCATNPTNAYGYEVSNGAVTITKYSGGDSDVEIPSEINGKPVTTIADNAFSNAEIKSVSIPDSITEIGTRAFYECDDLERATVPKSVTIMGSSAFAKCENATIYCETKSQPIGWRVDWSYNVKSVVWGYTTDDNGHDDSHGNGNAGGTDNGDADGGVDYSTIYNYESEDGGIIINKYWGTNSVVVIPSEIDGLPVTAIGENAFRLNRRVTSVTVPSGVKKIADGAFYECSYLSSVNIPDTVTEIDEGAFSFCVSLESIYIPDSVAKMGEYAFSGCYSLTIYCEAPFKPREWSYNWNYSRCDVWWGVKDMP